MSDSKVSSFPWASVAVLVAFVTSTQLVPHAFDPLRPPEKERAQSTLGGALEVDARLWEDPFIAVRRYESERLERCDKLYKVLADAQACKANASRGDESMRTYWGQLDHDGDQDVSETLVIAALVPGNPFVGAEEGRRRERYAILAGLAAKDYVPDNAERIGILEFNPLCLREPARAASAAAAAPAPAEASASGPSTGFTAADCQPEPLLAVAASAALAASAPAAAGVASRLLVPYELLTSRRSHRTPESKLQTRRYEQIALLWVDEAALPAPKLNALSRMLPALLPQLKSVRSGEVNRPRLSIIGPSSTDSLRVALADLKALTERPPSPLTRAGLHLFAKAEILNPNSTAHNNILDELDTQKLETFLNDRFTELFKPEQQGPVEIDYRRMIATDNELIRRLVSELQLRLPPDSRRRVVLVAERDSLYSQSLVNEFVHRINEQAKEEGNLSVEVVFYLRGLDGVTTRDASAPSGGNDRNDSGSSKLEWPEARDQLDYLRRMAQSLKRSDSVYGRGPIGAIGILGSDVHDKLLVLQAMHDTFSDKVFFTTDMDARFLHPRTQGFTRNLVVASSLPLSFYPSADKKLPDLQSGTPPLRDVYQSSAFLAARYAACRTRECADEEAAAARPALQDPSLYEIGRNRAVPLSGYAFTGGRPDHAQARLLLGAGLALLMLLGLLVWPSTPAIREAWRAYGHGHRQPHYHLSASVLTAAYAALASFGLCSLIEFVQPGHLSFTTMLLFATLAAFVVLLALLPAYMGTFDAAAAAAGGDGATPPRARQGMIRGSDLAQLMLLGLVVLAFASLAWPRAGSGLCSNCEPVAWLEGVSAWPSHLIHLLALILLVAMLDNCWARNRRDMQRDADALLLPRTAFQRLKQGRLRDYIRHWRRDISVLSWSRQLGGSTDVAEVWRQYVQRSDSWPVALRTVAWYCVTLGIVSLLYMGLSEGQIPEVPVRGSEHRDMVKATLYAVLILLPLLIVTVGDGTLLACRLILHLNSGRSFYPEASAIHFARSLGEGQQDQWLRTFAARPADRLLPGPQRHRLLDDWIDVQLVSARTASIAPMVVGPFAVLALLVVARSRLFDNWAMTPAIAVAASFYLIGLIGIAVMLKYAAEQTRKRALRSMAEDLRWLDGHPDPKMRELVKPFERLIAAVDGNQVGAFAPFFDQPLLKALLVPLGGAGGSQLFDYLLMAR